MIVCVTGHRPNKLGWGYDYNHECWEKLKSMFKERLVDIGCSDAWSGMALGVDAVFALAVLELREEGYPIKLHCAIPCREQSKIWPVTSQELYNSILDQADEVVLVSDAPYAPYLMQVRNEYMVNKSEIVLAVWDGSRGGTGNCVEYAKRCNKEIHCITPSSVEDLVYRRCC